MADAVSRIRKALEDAGLPHTATDIPDEPLRRAVRSSRGLLNSYVKNLDTVERATPPKAAQELATATAPVLKGILSPPGIAHLRDLAVLRRETLFVEIGKAAMFAGCA